MANEGWPEDDKYDDLDYQISVCLVCDNELGLISLLEDPGNFSRWDLIDNLCSYDNLTCATALLEGNLGVTLDVNRDYLLHHAALYSNFKLIRLFLSRGARTDIRLEDCSNPILQKYNGFLPLNIALDATRSSGYLSQWSPGRSTFQLIVYFCHPYLKRALAANKLLACSTKNVEVEAYNCAMEGKVIEFAILLFVAREKVLAPITCHSEKGAGLNQSMTILECLKNQIESLPHEESKLMGEFEQKKLTEILKKMMVMKSAALLLEVFERAGDTIEEYLQLQKRVVTGAEVENDVALRLKKAGFKLDYGDFGFGIGDYIEYCDSMRTPFIPSEKSSRRLSSHWTGLQNAVSSPREEVFGDGSLFSAPSYGSRNMQIIFPTKRSIHTNQAAKKVFSSHFSTSLNVLVKKEAIVGVPKCAPREKLAYIAMAIKRVIRRA